MAALEPISAAPSRPVGLDRRPGRRVGQVIMVLSAVTAVAVLHPLGLIGDRPLPLLLVLLAVWVVLRWLPFLRWTPEEGLSRLNLRLGPEVAVVGALIYATGWGPMLTVGYLIVVQDALRRAGSRAWRPALGWVLASLVAGQGAIAAGLVPSYVHAPDVYGLAILAGVVLVVGIRGLGLQAEDDEWEASERSQADGFVLRREQRLRALMQNSFDLVTVLDAYGQVTYASPSVEQVCGYTVEQYLSLAVGPYGRIHPDDREPTRRSLEALRNELAQQRTIELRHLHADGTWRWHEVKLRNLLADPAVAGFVANHRDVTERRSYERRLDHDANHDPLTGLMNRAAFNRHLARAVYTSRSGGEPMAVMLLDLNRFKQVNDTLGHGVGDQLLCEVGRRMVAELHGTDVVARLGGDEFAVLLSPSVKADGAPSTARRLIEALERPFALSDRSVWVGASLGAAYFPEHGDNPQALLHAADLAMYEAKRTAAGVVVYRDDLDHDDAGGAIGGALVLELPGAIHEDELVLFYQPKLDLATDEVHSVEALVRWRHPRLGLLNPADFIALAESTGLVRQVTSWVLAAALRQAARWSETGRNLGVAVNVSARDLVDESLPDRVASLLAQTGVRADDLTLELTESAIMADEVNGSAVLSKLRAQGVRVSLDDFGTGYSSLAYLERLPLDEFKIDRSFLAHTSNADDDFMVRSIIDIGRHLGLRVVAEGIEDPALFEALARMGCDELQGRGLSDPIPAEALNAWLDRRAAGASPD